MALIYITGPTGSGKSTICLELGKLGYEVYDTDKDGIRKWLDPKSGKPVKDFIKNQSLDMKWLNDHQLGLPIDWLADLKSRAEKSNIYVCGTSPIDHTDKAIFDKIFVLVIDEAIQKQRITDRTNNQYGKDPEQLQKALKWREPTIDRYVENGAVELDGTLSVNQIVKKILAKT